MIAALTSASLPQPSGRQTDGQTARRQAAHGPTTSQPAAAAVAVAARLNGGACRLGWQRVTMQHSGHKSIIVCRNVNAASQ